ncbi:carbonic anhydrase [Streptomyces sp. NRRL F-5727]|uniref:carbonic anhydrase n=1 Tax=Streptomyces sp. NRRL F-5727 TaxID=1463871 RepID=UPI0004CB9DA0|nr:carbonic anhydrase [Streptomyces sp. NRRL F-5727]
MTTSSERPASGGPPRAAASRRGLLRTAVGGAAAVTAGAWALDAPDASAAPRRRPRPATPEEALRELSAGNRRWRAFREKHPHETRAVRNELVSGQHPFAVVLGCIDSRVPPELVFDQGLGDLMTVRSAGEVLDEAVLGSVAYGVLELDIPLVMVLGHQACGAVSAAVHADETGATLPAHIQFVAEQIKPAIDRSLEGAARIDATITAQVRLVRARLAAEPDLAARIAAGRLAVVGARYELTSQAVHAIG